MKMVKSLLLGSAAGLVAVAGAQAADLPVKAKPVEYVKVCSMYGAGYYYLPGTNVCISPGGYVREEWAYGFGASISTGPWNSVSAPDNRISGNADTVWRTRAYVNIETREQTAYGTLRTYLNVGTSGNNSTDFNANRAFIQIAGFTVGRATSYFDHYSGAAVAYLVDLSSDSGDGGLEVFAYTAQLGNGVSASLSLENQFGRSYGVYREGDGYFNTSTGYGVSSKEKKRIMPEIVANLRVDQAWGSAQVMGALHDASGGYYGALQTSGHADDKLGWAVGAGIKLNLPMIAKGDYVAAQFAYTQGALKYICNHPGCSFDNHYDGTDQFGYGIWTDSVYGNATSETGIQLTTAWGVDAAWEHYWTPSLKTSLHGGYLKVSYNDTANAILCQDTVGTAYRFVWLTGTCDNDFARWQIGSRTQWNVTKKFYMGFDVLYQKIETASQGATATTYATAASAQLSPAAGGWTRTMEDQDNWAIRARWHRDLP